MDMEPRSLPTFKAFEVYCPAASGEGGCPEGPDGHAGGVLLSGEQM